MNNSELTLAAIGKGLDDDGTAAAALDAIREESGCSLLSAILEVARVWNGARTARELSEAAALTSHSSPIRTQLHQAITSECPLVPPGAHVTIVLVEGDQWPRSADTSLWHGAAYFPAASITVGALWVKREASRLQVENARDKKPTRKRRKR